MARKTRSKTLLSVAIGRQDRLILEDETVCVTASADDDTEWHSMLVLAIEHAFAPDRDRIVYEADVTAECFRADFRGRLIRPVGTGLSAALGFIGARDRLEQDHRVVLVACAGSTESILRELERRGPDRLEGCALVAPIPSARLASCREVLRRFESRGGRLLDLTTAHTLPKLTAGMESAAQQRAACLALIDPAMAPVWQRLSDSRTNGAGPTTKESVAERVLLSTMSLEIARHMRDDPRSTPVLLESRRPLEKLVEEFGTRVLSPGDLDIDESLAWCAALAQGGCHPVVVMNSHQLAEHLEALRAHLLPLEQRATVIVLDSVTPSLNPTESPLTPVLADVPVVVPGTPDEVAPLTKAALRADGPRLLYLPIASDLFRAERDRWLDFRAAAGLRERAGREPDSTTLPLMVGPVQRESREILNRQFSTDAAGWVRAYVHCGGGRNSDAWRWVNHAIQLLELPSVDPEWRRPNRDTKFLAAMFHWLLEEAAEDGTGGAHELAQLLMRCPEQRRAEASSVHRAPDRRQLITHVWDELWRRAAAYPRFAEFADILRYDFRQLCNTIHYTDLVLRQPEMTNSVEHAMYSPHGVIVTCNATLDLMCSPRFDSNQLGPLREALHHAACMARYGELSAFPEREIRTGGSNGRAIASALRNGRPCPMEVPPGDPGRAGGAPAMERAFLNRWQIHRACVLNLRERVSSCSLRSYVDGLDRLLASASAVVPATSNRRAAAVDG